MSTVAGTGISTSAGAAQAGCEAARQALDHAGIDRADWGIIFATSAHRPHYAAMLRAVQGELGTEMLTGCSASGVLTQSQEIEGGSAVAVLAVRSDRIAARTMIAQVGEGDTREAAAQFGKQITGSPGLLVLLPDPYSMRPEDLLQELERSAPGVEAVGAAASGDPRQGVSFQFYGRNVAKSSLAGLHLSGKMHHVIAITQGCQPLGEPCRVTRATRNVIHELDGQPALEVLRSRLPPTLRDSLSRLGAHIFVGVPPDPAQDRIEPGEYLVRHLLGSDREGGSLEVGTIVREGQPIVPVLREGQSAREDLKQMLARIEPASDSLPYRFGFYFNCAARGTSLYGFPGIDTAYISGAFGDIPIIGFFGNAEIAPLRGKNRLFSYTGVLVLLSDIG